MRLHDAPQALAIVTPERAITYGEFHERVGQLATSILERCSASTWLPIVVDRSIESAIAYQAAIRAGRAFVPIEASLPPARVAELLALADNPSSAVVSRAELAAVLPTDVTAVGPGDSHRTVADAVPVSATDPAWLCFTSGSTGVPKGVYASWADVDRAIDLFGIDTPDTATRLSSVWPMGFLAGVMWVWRLSGGIRLCMIDPASRSLEDLVTWFADQEITIANFGGALSASIARLDGRRLPTVEEYSVGQSGADWSWVERIRNLCSPEVVVVNNWDASEAGYGYRFRIGPDHEILSGPLPIARLGGDPRLRLEPYESAYEILFRDPATIGYYGMADLTAERYFFDEDGTRWWHSRDLATVDDDGYVLFAGRMDLMVKINGIRIEPAESEVALRSIPGITSAAVVAHPITDGSVRLVGHVCVDDPSLTPAIVRSQLSEKVPAHLIPSVFVRHESLPATDRGKIDRETLREMPLVRWRTVPYAKSFHPVEMWLRDKLEKIIGLGPVGADDDLWEAGLDSMGAVELCSAIAADDLGDIDPTVLLRASTITALVAELAVGRPHSGSPVVILNPGGTRTPIVAVPGIGGTSLAFRGLAAALGADQPLIIVEARGMHSRGRVELTVEERVETLIGEIETRLDPGQPFILIGYSLGATIAFAAASTLIAQGRHLHLVLLDGVLAGRGYPLDTDPDERMRVDPRPHQARSRLGSRLSTLLEPMRIFVVARTLHLRRGRRRYDRAYYGIFKRLGAAAAEKYAIEPAPVPTTLFRIAETKNQDAITTLVGPLDVHWVEGDHFSMLDSPQVEPIAREIAAIRQRVVPTRA